MMIHRNNKRDLVTGITIRRGASTNVVLRNYTYDALGRPLTRSTARNGTTQNDAFGYNARSELTSATLGNDEYAYAFDNIGNRECGYDSQGRRCFKKVTVAGTVTLHHRYIYRGYLQIACVDLTRAAHPALWFVLWDPTQETATRPLALQKNGSWFTYGHDLTKNVWEVFGPSGYIRTSYSYAPFGAVSASGDVTQPFQWSSEHYDSETALVYYNFRHYSPDLGRWLSRDPIEEKGGRNLYAFVKNNSENSYDFRGRCAGNIFECAIGHVWDGISCVATGIGSGVSCAAGYVWDGAMCVSEFIVAGAKRIIDGVVYVWDGARWLVEKTIEFILGHCGSGTLSLLIVPDRPFFIASVSECCIEHDNCYATLCASKKDCDDALGACVKSKISSSLGIADLGEYPSSFIGEGYRLGVHLGGGKAFEDAQKEAKGDCLRRQK